MLKGNSGAACFYIYDIELDHMKCLQKQKPPGFFSPDKSESKKCLFILVLSVSFYDTD